MPSAIATERLHKFILAKIIGNSDFMHYDGGRISCKPTSSLYNSVFFHHFNIPKVCICSAIYPKANGATIIRAKL